MVWGRGCKCQYLVEWREQFCVAASASAGVWLQLPAGVWLPVPALPQTGLIVSAWLLVPARARLPASVGVWLQVPAPGRVT